MLKRKPDYKKIICFWAAIFLLGGVAGILGSQIFLPWLAGFSPFNKIVWIERSRTGTTIINQTERVTINQDQAYSDAVGRLANSVVGIRAEKHYRLVNQKQLLLTKPEILAEGSGFVLTSDGAIVTAGVLAPETATRFIVIMGGKETEAQVIKRDGLNGLALLRISASNLPVVTFGDIGGLKLGETIFLLGAGNATTTSNYFTNAGFVRTILPEISFSFTEGQLGNGSPLVDLQGEVMGLNLIDKDGKITMVAADNLRALLK